MAWLNRVFSRRPYSVSVDEARCLFTYRERGRRIEVLGEAMADGYAIYSASIIEWQAGGVVDEAERQRIAANIRSYFVDRGKSIYLS